VNEAHRGIAGAMFYFPDPAAAVASGLELVERVDGSCLPPARMGIAAGAVVFHEGDCFGRTVNIAARVMDRVRPRTVRATREVVEASDPHVARFEDIGAGSVKGVAEPVRPAVAYRPG
jgi:class 3 adenylate cyclase